MGYDIFSMREDKAAAEAYARKHTKWLFDANGNYTGSEAVYYRLNIWGMGILRQLNEKLGVEYLNNALWDNSGTVIRDWECHEASEHLNGIPDEVIREAVQEVVKGDEHLDNPEEIQAWVNEVRSWQEYLRICGALKGCEVL